MYMPKPNSDFVNPPEGTHSARCWRVIDLGTQAEDFQGQIKYQRKILVSWELHCDERMDDGRLFTIGKKYTLSGHEKSNLRKDLESWRGKKFEDHEFGPGGFDISKLIGVGCLLNLTSSETKGTTYVNVTGVMKPMKGMEIPKLENETVFLSLEKGSWDPEVFGKLSDKLKETIRKSPEFIELNPPVRPDKTTQSDGKSKKDELDDDIPF